MQHLSSKLRLQNQDEELNAEKVYPTTKSPQRIRIGSYPSRVPKLIQTFGESSSKFTVDSVNLRTSLEFFSFKILDSEFALKRVRHATTKASSEDFDPAIASADSRDASANRGSVRGQPRLTFNF